MTRCDQSLAEFSKSHQNVVWELLDDDISRLSEFYCSNCPNILMTSWWRQIQFRLIRWRHLLTLLKTQESYWYLILKSLQLKYDNEIKTLTSKLCLTDAIYYRLPFMRLKWIELGTLIKQCKTTSTKGCQLGTVLLELKVQCPRPCHRTYIVYVSIQWNKI